MDKEILQGCKTVTDLYQRLLEAEGLDRPQVPIELSLTVLLAHLVMRNKSHTLFEALDEQIQILIPESERLYKLHAQPFSDPIAPNFKLRMTELALFEILVEERGFSKRKADSYLADLGLPSGLRDKVNKDSKNAKIRNYADELKKAYYDNDWSFDWLIELYFSHKQKK